MDETQARKRVEIVSLYVQKLPTKMPTFSSPSFHATILNDLAYNSSAFHLKFCHMFFVHPVILSELLGNCLLHERIISSTFDNLRYWIPCSNVFHFSWCTARSSWKISFPHIWEELPLEAQNFWSFPNPHSGCKKCGGLKPSWETKSTQAALLPSSLLITQEPSEGLETRTTISWKSQYPQLY